MEFGGTRSPTFHRAKDGRLSTGRFKNFSQKYLEQVPSGNRLFLFLTVNNLFPDEEIELEWQHTSLEYFGTQLGKWVCS